MKKKRYDIVILIQNFFPLQLLIAHLKYNVFGVFAWLVLLLFALGDIGERFGFPILFYSPEYLGNVSFISFALIGFGIGGFTMAFNSYSFRKLGKRFPFIVFVRNPFFIFCKNNSFLPILFSIIYLVQVTIYQLNQEFADYFQLSLYLVAYVLGYAFFVMLSFMYFFPTSRKSNLPYNYVDEDYSTLKQTIKTKDETWYSHVFADTEKRYLYLVKRFRLKISRRIDHLEEAHVEKALNKNRINTSLFELLTIVFFVGMSLFSNYRLLEIPAAMSIIWLLTLIFIFYSLLQTWFRNWAYIIFIFFVLTLNYVSKKSRFFTYKSYAYGLNYESKNKPEYTISAIEANAKEDIVRGHSPSKSNYLEILENWKLKTGEEKPKLIFINSSGGGLRSTLWTFEILQRLDKEFNGQLKKFIHLYTGASGGMVGSSYFRELCLRQIKEERHHIYSDEYFDILSKDMLNKLAFSASTRDLFFRWQHFDYGGYSYPKDRGWAFEQQLHENTNHLMDYQLGYYHKYEKAGLIPLLIITPTIVNDGRRLLISSQSLQFLTAPTSNMPTAFENIDYQSFFSEMNPQNLRLSTALRAGATFPYVTPMVSMPSIPEIQLMDAGFRDNYGTKITLEILLSLKDWIYENTSGVLILQLRDTRKILENTKYPKLSMLDKLKMPFMNIYTNFPKTQDFTQEQLLKISHQSFKFPLDVISFNLRENTQDKISLSWHLSKQEKQKIKQAFYSKLNQQSYRKLKEIMNDYLK